MSPLPRAQDAPALPRRLGLWSSVAVIVGLTRNAFGNLPAFLFGWAMLSMIGAAGAAGIATAFAELFSPRRRSGPARRA